MKLSFEKSDTETGTAETHTAFKAGDLGSAIKGFRDSMGKDKAEGESPAANKATRDETDPDKPAT